MIYLLFILITLAVLLLFVMERKKASDITQEKETLLEEIKSKEEGLEKKMKYFARLNETARLLNFMRTKEKVYENILNLAVESLGADRGSLMLFDDTERDLYIRASIGLDCKYAGLRFQLGEGIAGMVADEKIPILVKDIRQDHNFIFFKDNDYDTRSMISVPLETPDKLLGVINVESTAANRQFTENELQFLYAFANQAAVSIHNYILYNEIDASYGKINDKLEELSILYEASTTSSVIMGLNSLIKKIMEMLSAALNTEASSILIYNEQNDTLEFTVATGGVSDKLDRFVIKSGTGIAGRVFQTGEHVLANDVRTNPMFNPEIDHITGFSTRSILCVPMKIRGKIIGVIEVVNKTEGDFDEDDLNLLFTLANLFASAINNNRLYDELTGLKNFNDNLLSSMNSGVITIDENSLITLYNKSAERILGYPLSEVYRRDIREIMTDAVSGQCIMTDSLEKDIVYQNFEQKIKNKAGNIIPVGLSTSIMKDHQNKVGCIATFTDLTLIKKLEEEVRRTDRLNSLREMALGIAHELKNPISAIQGSIQVLKGRVKSESSEVAEILEIILKESKRLDNIITNFSDFVKPVKLTLEKDDLNGIIMETVKLIRFDKSFHGQIEIEECLAPDLPKLLLDREKIKQVIINLLINSSDAINGGGKIKIRTRVFQSSIRIKSPLNIKNVFIQSPLISNIQMIVEDTGAGIEENIIGNIFSPFYTTKEKGIGLGLAIVHKIIDEHGGIINVESVPGKGTAFTISLPVAE